MSKKLRVLIVDDDHSMAKTLSDILQVKGFRSDIVHSGEEALEKVEKHQFDCVLSDIRMPGMNGVELNKSIQEIQPEVPVLLMTAYSRDDVIKAGLEEGVIAVITKPLDLNLLLNFLATLREDRSIVIIDDDANFCMTLGDILKERGFRVSSITDPHTVDQINLDEIEIVMLDMKLNHINGVEVLEQIRDEHPEIPVILVTGYISEMEELIDRALEFNAHVVLNKPLDIHKLFEVLKQIRHQELGEALGA